ncbi:MAPEG family protein [Pseudomonas sp. LS44]|uniref:MAPEG family protein n=1 Tax=Pseudomonas sp. LS44 TaxID=1357074 RepID=UPI00215AB092|nr:MAPEG family protein [Pseudomonas sp. LS44]UVE18141.1 MAPEG family protein [Pseudomonas sp. LS44]
MTLAFWCVLVVILLPYLGTAIAKFSGGDYGPQANQNPRAFLAGLSDMRQRAHHAQLNGFEVAPAFAAAVIIAHLAGGASQALIDSLAVGFVISRLVYLGCYLADWGPVRSLVWFMGMGLIVALFVVAA